MNPEINNAYQFVEHFGCTKATEIITAARSEVTVVNGSDYSFHLEELKQAVEDFEFYKRSYWYQFSDEKARQYPHMMTAEYIEIRNRIYAALGQPLIVKK